MRQWEITLRMIYHRMNIGMIISRAQITLYIVSSENNVCNPQTLAVTELLF